MAAFIRGRSSREVHFQSRDPTGVLTLHLVGMGKVQKFKGEKENFSPPFSLYLTQEFKAFVVSHNEMFDCRNQIYFAAHSAEE